MAWHQLIFLTYFIYFIIETSKIAYYRNVTGFLKQYDIDISLVYDFSRKLKACNYDKSSHDWWLWKQFKMFCTSSHELMPKRVQNVKAYLINCDVIVCCRRTAKAIHGWTLVCGNGDICNNRGVGDQRLYNIFCHVSGLIFWIYVLKD